MNRHSRVIEPELLDDLPAEQGRASLRDLERLNRRWGGASTLRWLLRRAGASGEFSVLDVGAASGDMGAVIRESYSGARVTSLDYIPWHLESAAQPKVAGDAFALPFRDASFDFVFCSLFLHHFTNEQVVALLREFARVSKNAVLVVDLLRSPIAYYFVPWTQWLFGWDPVTCNDASISVAAAFLPRELEALAERAGLSAARARAFRPAYRIAMIAAAHQI